MAIVAKDSSVVVDRECRCQSGRVRLSLQREGDFGVTVEKLGANGIREQHLSYHWLDQQINFIGPEVLKMLIKNPFTGLVMSSDERVTLIGEREYGYQGFVNGIPMSTLTPSRQRLASGQKTDGFMAKCQYQGVTLPIFVALD